jgi:hypothetical protein
MPGMLGIVLTAAVIAEVCLPVYFLFPVDLQNETDLSLQSIHIHA